MANFRKQIYHYKMNSKKFVKNLCNLEDKLARNTFTLFEAHILADALGYDLELVKRK